MNANNNDIIYMNRGGRQHHTEANTYNSKMFRKKRCGTAH